MAAAVLEFEPMQPDDLDRVMVAETQIYPFPWTRGNFADSLVSGHRAWVARARGQLVGYGVVTITLDEAQLLNISVVPERQGEGLGRQLIDHLMADARACRAARMFLEVRPSNRAGRALYERCGFLQVGLRKGYYPAADGREDALVMARDLP